MGNGESTYDDSDDNVTHEPPTYATHEPPSYAAHEPPSYAGTSTNSSYQKKLPSTRIGDNFNSLDQVSTTSITYIVMNLRVILNICLL